MKIITSVPVERVEVGGEVLFLRPGDERPSVYPFHLIPVGEHFNVSGCENKKVKAAASIYGKRLGMRFRARVQPDGSTTVYRVL